jgi:hypothetical protein
MQYSIQKVLLVESPEHFYKILFKENWMSGGVDEFLKAYFRFEYGCPCDSEKHWLIVTEEYKDLVNKNLDGLVQKIGCDKIEFKYDNN